MKRMFILKLVICLLLVNFSATAQKNKKQRGDSLTVYREFFSLGQWYLNVPLQMKVHFINKTMPAITGQDSIEADMILYYGKKDFYIQAKGMEQIANDTILVLVNNEAKMINLYPNNGQLLEYMEKMLSSPIADSSLEKLARQYTGRMEDESKSMKRIELQSRDKIFGTDLSRETIKITYQANTHQPVMYSRSKLSLLPVDSVVYSMMADDSHYTGRMVSTKKNEGNLFFIVKEQITRCQFSQVTHDQQTPPVREQDRIVKTTNGGYEPAEGFKDYLVMKEF